MAAAKRQGGAIHEPSRRPLYHDRRGGREVEIDAVLYVSLSETSARLATLFFCSGVKLLGEGNHSRCANGQDQIFGVADNQRQRLPAGASLCSGKGGPQFWRRPP